MSIVEEAEDDVTNLPNEGPEGLRSQPGESDASAWDRQFERDAAEGRLDALADEALHDLRDRRCTDQ